MRSKELWWGSMSTSSISPICKCVKECFLLPGMDNPSDREATCRGEAKNHVFVSVKENQNIQRLK